MAKLRIPYGLPLTRHRNQSLDSANCIIEASPESRCLMSRFVKLTKSQYVMQKLHTDRKVLSMISCLYARHAISQGKYEYPKPIPNRLRRPRRIDEPA